MRMGLRLHAVTGAFVRTGQSTTASERQVIMTTQTITVVDVVDKAIELAEARPDYRYNIPDRCGSQAACSYVPRPGSPDGCIFGQVVIALGMWPQTLVEFERREQGHGGTGVISMLVFLGVIQAPPDIHDLPPWALHLANAQSQQDNECLWGVEVLAELRQAKEALA